MMRVFVEVGRETSVIRPSWFIPRSAIALRKRRPGRSSPTTPESSTSAPSVRALTATLVAPPGTVRSSLRSRISTGASREMRLGLPIRYSSATISPITRMRLPAKLEISACTRSLAIRRCALAAMLRASFHDHPEREARQGEHAPPAPRLAIETIEPLDAEALHQAGRALLAARNKVIRAPHADGQRGRQARKV